MAVWDTRSKAKVTHSFTSFAWSLQKNGVLSERCFKSQLVKGEHFSPSLEDTGPHTLCKPQSTDLMRRCGTMSAPIHTDTQSLTVSLGISNILTSLVTVPTTTAILLVLSGGFI